MIIEILPEIITGIASFAVGAGAFTAVGYTIRKKKAEKQIGSAELEVKRIYEEGAKQAESLKKEALISAKEEILKQRNEAEKEMKERRADISRMERRITQKEENLDKKSETLERKSEQLDKKIKENEALTEQINQLREQEMKILEKISGVTVEEAKQELLDRTESYTCVLVTTSVNLSPAFLRNSSEPTLRSEVAATSRLTAFQIAHQVSSSAKAGALEATSSILSRNVFSSLIQSTVLLPMLVSKYPISLIIATGAYFLTSAHVSLCLEASGLSTKYLAST